VIFIKISEMLLLNKRDIKIKDDLDFET